MSQYSSLKNKLIKGDSIDELKKLDDNSVDLLCTDPPYGYGFMGKDWDKMLPPKEIFQESLRVLKPGSFAFVMSAPRSDVQYRMAQMLDEVGFEIGYTPIYWTYATGFPKAMNIGKAVDKRGGQDLNWFIDYILKVAKEKNITKKELSMLFPSKKTGKPTGWLWNKQKTQGITLEQYNKIKDFLKLPFDTVEEAEREVIGKKSSGLGSGKTYAFTDDNDKFKGEVDITIPKTDKAKELDGSYGGYQPKPAVEVVIVAMKPLSQKGYLDQALDNQKGITWLDDCRIPFAGTSDESSPLGRFAANLLVSDDVLDDGIIRKAGKYKGEGSKSGGIWQKSTGKPAGREYGDEGGFSRYYSLDAWWISRMDKLPDEVRNTFPFLVVPKASKSEKNIGLDDFEVKQKDIRTDTGKGSFTEKGLQPGKNIHPTVKPMNLMSYLVTLGSRKNDVVLDPFMGSGTTPMACVTLGRNYIGVEREEEYFEIAEARVNKLENPLKQWEQWV